jgi:hypothetical protein
MGKRQGSMQTGCDVQSNAEILEVLRGVAGGRPAERKGSIGELFEGSLVSNPELQKGSLPSSCLLGADHQRSKGCWNTGRRENRPVLGRLAFRA